MKHPALHVTLRTLLLVLLAGVGAVYGIYYATPSVPLPEAKASSGPLLSNRVVHALDETASTGKVSFSVSEDDLNQSFANSYAQLPDSVRKVLSGVYLDITDSSYNFYAEVTHPVFKTEILFKTHLEEKKDEKDPLSGAYLFRVDNIFVGRLGGMDRIAFKTLRRFAKPEDLEKQFADKGLHVTFDFDHEQIVYTKKDLLSDFGKKAADGDSSSLFTNLLSTLMRQDGLSLAAGKADAFSVTADLTPFHENAAYTDSGRLKDSQMEKLRHKMNILVQTDAIKESQADDYLRYLMRGYQFVSESIQNEVKDKDLTKIGIADPKTYVGPVLTSSYSLADAVKSQFASLDPSSLASGTILTLDEEDIAKTLMYSSLYGTAKSLVDPREKKTAFLALDNAYDDIQEDKASFVVTMNVNGYETSLILDTSYLSFQDLKLTLHVEKSYYGTTILDSSFQEYLGKKMEESLSKEEGSLLSFDAESQNFVFDFSKSLTPELANALASKNLKAKLSGENLAADGKITLSID